MSQPTSPAIIPYLTVSDGPAALALYVELFGFKEGLRLPLPDGRIAHAELELDGCMLFIADAFPEAGLVGPDPAAGVPVSIALRVNDVDALVARALETGCTLEGEVADQFHGSRSAKLRDPFGHRWLLDQQLEQLDNDEIEKRFAAMFAG